MTTRERLERKAELRRDWAERRRQRAAADFDRGDLREEKSGIPFGQPILVGHHSERRHRRAIERADNATRRACESMSMAQHHESKAAGLEDQLDRCIFSDDDNAVEALRARIAEREQQAAEWKRINAAWKKSKGVPATFAELAGISIEAAEKIAAKIATAYSWCKMPYPSYSMTNLRARINADKKRLDQVQALNRTKQAAAESEAGVVVLGGDWVSITFAEKPDRSILQDLKAAGFRWGRGSWTGERAKIPASVQAIV